MFKELKKIKNQKSNITFIPLTLYLNEIKKRKEENSLLINYSFFKSKETQTKKRIVQNSIKPISLINV